MAKFKNKTFIKGAGPTNDTPMKKGGGVDKKTVKLNRHGQPKHPRPVSKDSKEANKGAWRAFSNGDVGKEAFNRRAEQDLRTLYVKFTGSPLPSSHDDIKALHSDIMFVRTPMKAGGNKATQVEFSYAFIEFGSEQLCTAAKNRLATSRFQGNELYVDFVGEKSKKKNGEIKRDTSKPLNPCRLVVFGLPPDVRKESLKQMFPKCSSAELPLRSIRKKCPFGFVQFSNPGDAKAAFDAAKDLVVAGRHITVLYATITEDKAKVKEKKAEKRKLQEKKKKEEAKKAKLEAAAAASEESSDEENDDDDDEEEEEEEDGDGEVTINKDKSVLVGNENDDTVEEVKGEDDDDDDDDDDGDDDDDDDEDDDNDEEGDDDEGGGIKVEEENDDEEDGDDDNDDDEEGDDEEGGGVKVEKEDDDDDDDEEDEGDDDDDDDDEDDDDDGD